MVTDIKSLSEGRRSSQDRPSQCVTKKDNIVPFSVSNYALKYVGIEGTHDLSRAYIQT